MNKIWSKKIIISALIIAAIYVMATVYLMNAGLVKDTIFGDYPISYKWNLLIALLAGMWTAMSMPSLFFLIVVAILAGVNLVLIFERLQTVRLSGGMRLAVGGSSFLGIVGSGCASCGLPILALLGLGGAAAYLPFQGLEISFLAIFLLTFSLYVLIKGRGEQATCRTGILKLNNDVQRFAEGGEEV